MTPLQLHAESCTTCATAFATRRADLITSCPTGHAIATTAVAEAVGESVRELLDADAAKRKDLTHGS